MHVLGVFKKLRWQPNKLLLAFYVLFLCVFITLGFWQLSRAEEKQQWLSQRDQSSVAQSSFVNNLENFTGQEFKPISLRGQFSNSHAWLLQNQRVNNQLGFDLIAPFQPQYGPAILVNLGWQANGNVSTWLKTSGQTIVIQGKVRKPMDLPFVSNVFSGQTDSVVELTPNGFPYNNLEHRWYLQISPQHPLAQLTHWQHKTISPAKHTAYAAQWFAMALVLSVAFFIATTNISKLWRPPQQPTSSSPLQQVKK